MVGYIWLYRPISSVLCAGHCCYDHFYMCTVSSFFIFKITLAKVDNNNLSLLHSEMNCRGSCNHFRYIYCCSTVWKLIVQLHTLTVVIRLKTCAKSFYLLCVTDVIYIKLSFVWVYTTCVQMFALCTQSRKHVMRKMVWMKIVRII